MQQKQADAEDDEKANRWVTEYNIQKKKLYDLKRKKLKSSQNYITKSKL